MIHRNDEESSWNRVIILRRALIYLGAVASAILLGTVGVLWLQSPLTVASIGGHLRGSSHLDLQFISPGTARLVLGEGFPKTGEGHFGVAVTGAHERALLGIPVKHELLPGVTVERYPSFTTHFIDAHVYGTLRYTAWVVSGWWIIFPLLILPSLAARQFYVVRRRFPRGSCRNCGYDLRGSGNRCPECGKYQKMVDGPPNSLLT